VVGVGAHEVVPRLGDAVAVAIHVVLVNIAAQHGDVRGPIALREQRLGRRKAAVQRHAVGQCEGGSARMARLPAALVRVVHALRHPNLVAGDGDGQRVLHIRVGVRPREAGCRAGRVRVHTNSPVVAAGRPGGQRLHTQPYSQRQQQRQGPTENPRCIVFMVRHFSILSFRNYENANDAQSVETQNFASLPRPTRHHGNCLAINGK